MRVTHNSLTTDKPVALEFLIKLEFGPIPRKIREYYHYHRHISLLWLIDSCQNKVFADQYHVTISWAQV